MTNIYVPKLKDFFSGMEISTLNPIPTARTMYITSLESWQYYFHEGVKIKSKMKMKFYVNQREGGKGGGASREIE